MSLYGEYYLCKDEESDFELNLLHLRDAFISLSNGWELNSEKLFSEISHIDTEHPLCGILIYRKLETIFDSTGEIYTTLNVILGSVSIYGENGRHGVVKNPSKIEVRPIIPVMKMFINTKNSENTWRYQTNKILDTNEPIILDKETNFFRMIVDNKGFENAFKQFKQEDNKPKLTFWNNLLLHMLGK